MFVAGNYKSQPQFRQITAGLWVSTLLFGCSAYRLIARAFTTFIRWKHYQTVIAVGHLPVRNAATVGRQCCSILRYVCKWDGLCARQPSQPFLSPSFSVTLSLSSPYWRPICLSSIQAAVTRTLPLWQPQVQVSGAKQTGVNIVSVFFFPPVVLQCCLTLWGGQEYVLSMGCWLHISFLGIVCTFIVYPVLKLIVGPVYKPSLSVHLVLAKNLKWPDTTWDIWNFVHFFSEVLVFKDFFVYICPHRVIGIGQSQNGQGKSPSQGMSILSLILQLSESPLHELHRSKLN